MVWCYPESRSFLLVLQTFSITFHGESHGSEATSAHPPMEKGEASGILDRPFGHQDWCNFLCTSMSLFFAWPS